MNKKLQQPHPQISFKEYCQKFNQPPPIKQNKTIYVLGDVHSNLEREKQKEQFRSFVHDHISLTRQIRNTAEFDSTSFMGLTQKWQRDKQDYFHRELPLMKCELDMKKVKVCQDLSFETWRRIDQVSQKRARGLSLQTTLRKTQFKPHHNSFRF